MHCRLVSVHVYLLLKTQTRFKNVLKLLALSTSAGFHYTSLSPLLHCPDNFPLLPDPLFLLPQACMYTDLLPVLLYDRQALAIIITYISTHSHIEIKKRKVRNKRQTIKSGSWVFCFVFLHWQFYGETINQLSGATLE